MPASTSDYPIFRRRLGVEVDNTTLYPDDYINGLYDEAAVLYGAYSPVVILQAAVVEEWDARLAQAINEADYDEGDASESRNQVFKNIQANFIKNQQKLNALIAAEDAAASTGLAARWGGLRSTKSKRWRDYPR